ncbi:PPOX class F420-dependent oxidoreductase [Naasia lichenicola]|uniref:PPOX class F420-dependent oxidoreductase n=1 Tax=Naasia lichenicola TaxID=2565933 RepID=A0A4S4FH89_9MICO|nr:PPOX class F420-dependent oxidoreductase [Naasia lichenicola]THG28455.1 PPOX class F420-dependent oxidoreductase [Naasia lichenicola]
MQLTPDLLELLHGKSICYLATTMPKGSPQITQTWVDTDGERIIINTVEGFQKVRNIRRDPRVALTVSDPANPTRYIQVRGRVVDVTAEGGAEGIEAMSQKYTGRPYPWYGGRDQTRLILTIEADHISGEG